MPTGCGLDDTQSSVQTQSYRLLSGSVGLSGRSYVRHWAIVNQADQLPKLAVVVGSSIVGDVFGYHEVQSVVLDDQGMNLGNWNAECQHVGGKNSLLSQQIPRVYARIVVIHYPAIHRGPDSDWPESSRLCPKDKELQSRPGYFDTGHAPLLIVRSELRSKLSEDKPYPILHRVLPGETRNVHGMIQYRPNNTIRHIQNDRRRRPDSSPLQPHDPRYAGGYAAPRTPAQAWGQRSFHQ